MLRMSKIWRLPRPLLSIGCAFGILAAGSCKEIFERSLDKANVTLSAPANNVVSDSATQTFYWQPVDTNINYELQIVTPTFDSAVSLIADTTVNANVFSITLAPAQYQWRVRAFNSTSSTVFSLPWNLNIN